MKTLHIKTAIGTVLLSIVASVSSANSNNYYDMLKAAFAPSISSVLQSLSKYGTEPLEILANHAREAAKNNVNFNINSLDTRKYSATGGRGIEHIVFTAVAQFLNCSPTIAQFTTTGARANIKRQALAFLFDAVLTELATLNEHNEADDGILEIINHALGGNIGLH